MAFVESLKQRAKQDPKIIVLPEYGQDRDGVMKEAADCATADGTARVVRLTEQSIKDSGKMDELAEAYAAMRGRDKAIGLRALANPIAFGVMMVRAGYAHGMVAGRYAKSGDVMKFANAIVGEEEGRISSGLFFREPPEGYPVFELIACGDMVVHENPNAEELYKIIVTSAETFRDLAGRDPRIAVLSYVTGEPSSMHLQKDPEMPKIKGALEMYKSGGHPWPIYLAQGDAALRPGVAVIKGAPYTDRPADLLIGSSLNLSNPVYKLLQELIVGGRSMFVTQGLRLPVMDLSRGDTAANIEAVIAACSVRAQMFEKQGRYGTVSDHFVK